MAETAQWTILVFLNAKNDLEQFSFPNFAQMASIGSTPQVNIVVEFGRPQRHYSNDFGSWSKTLRFHVKKGMLPLESNAIEDLGSVNMGDGAALGEFVNWGRTRFPAKRYMLVVWNHGQGWRARSATRIRGDSEAVAKYVAMRSELRREAASGGPEPIGIADDARVHGGIRYVSNDDDTGDKLYNREIQDTLLAVLKGERLDIVAFDACLMAMVETAYALRNVADVMVGSEELEPGSGWNYERWLRPLVDARGEVDAAQLGKLIVKGFEDEFGDYDQTTQSAISLDKVQDLAASISAFAQTAIPLSNAANIGAFRNARAACANYAPGYGLHSIDLGRYMEQVSQSGLDATLRKRADDVISRLRAAVIANYASATRKGKFGSNGLAIYFPHAGFAYAADRDAEGYAPNNQRFPVEFVQKEKWADFLHGYWRLVP
jgi:hypothetical protein